VWRRVITAALVAASLALAGRAGFRAEVGPVFSVRGYVEESIWQVGGLELAAGLDVRMPEATITPYTALIYKDGGWWIAVELAKPVPDAGWRFALMGGVSW